MPFILKSWTGLTKEIIAPDCGDDADEYDQWQE
jgi:hypothetical protein